MSSDSKTDIVPDKIELPAIATEESMALQHLTSSIGVPRNVIASDEQIQYAWSSLPRILSKIPVEYRSPLLARMCIAVRTGLFDSAINYAWNTAVVSLRKKLTDFGLPVASQLLERDLTDGKLVDITDADLLKYCLELNLLSEDGYYFLGQCRDIRNNYSAAHPVLGDDVIDDTEFTNFLNRCAKYAFDSSNDPKGIDVKEFLRVLKIGRFDEEQKTYWSTRISETNTKQQEFIFTTLHGLYCDDSSSEETRLNCITLCKASSERITPRVISALINQHQDYAGKGDAKRLTASRIYFEKLGMLNVLDERERHSIITLAAQKLLQVHNAMNNFYNEPPFAERLLELSTQGAIPDTAKVEFVQSVVTCAVGNEWGTSNAALSFYEKIIKGFSQTEIKIMLNLPQSNTTVGWRIKNSNRCQRQFKRLVGLLSQESIPASLQGIYQKLMQ